MLRIRPPPVSSRGERVRPARSHRVGLAEVEATGPFEDAWRRLRRAAISLWYGNPRSDEMSRTVSVCNRRKRGLQLGMVH